MNFKELVRVGKDAVTRYTQGGKPVTGFSAAFDNGWGDNKQTVWLDCSWWGERGTKVAEYITKGSQIVVEGSIGTREYEGKTHVTLDVSDVRLVGGGSGGSKGGAPNRERPAKATDEPREPNLDDDIPFVTQHGRF